VAQARILTDKRFRGWHGAAVRVAHDMRYGAAIARPDGNLAMRVDGR
jgi:hypothetical protein